ncbi:MAG: acyltransferase family protein [Pseudomonadota bacterium]
MTYRADIDGLRAIAVLAVIAFHFSVFDLPGGYLGVDVFFVVSGYLITRIIWAEIQAGTFTLATFYERRIRRIMPLLVVVLLCSTVAALFILLPSDLVRFAVSLIATLAFVANIYFWRDTNYFAPAADEKPLLHMWSLGVEEQFYILLPVLLIVVARFAPKWVAAVILLTVLTSLVANTALNVIGGRSPAFYLLPTRIWELGLGSLLAVLPNRTSPSSLGAEIAAIVGLALVIAGIAFADHIPGPVPAAVPVVVGTVLMIWSGGTAKTRIATALSVTPVRFVGRISYALYLWHWPVLVFSTYYLVRELSQIETLAAIALVFALSVASLYMVETPARDRRRSFRAVAAALSVGAVVLVAGGVATIMMSGLQGRLPVQAAVINEAAGTNYRCAVTDFVPFGSSRACRLHVPSGSLAEAQIVLFGNSHAQMYAPLIEEAARQTNASAILVPMNGCLPITNINISRGCIGQAERNIAAIESLPEAERTLVAFNWEVDQREHVYADGTPVTDFHAELIAGLNMLVDRLEAADIEAQLVGPIPVPGYDLASQYSRALAFGHTFSRPLAVPYADFEQRHADAVASLKERLGVRFVEPHSALCDDTECNWIIDGRSIFSDSNHIAMGELHRFRPFFAEALN